ncbi:MAG: sugar ABC transporter permease [Candidatus Brocadiae bacterium]|nr:sugar ABC transporter permease [Candidatus Brocadiia bacterium]
MGSRSRYLWLLPSAALLGVILALPLLKGLAGGVPGIGDALRDPAVGRAAWNTCLFAGISVPLELGLGLAFALLLNRDFRGRGLARALAILPWALPTAVMALSWRWIFSDSWGIANDLPRALGLLEEPVPWLGRPGTAMAALIAADVWKTTPFVTLILLAGLQGVPSDLYEAMSLDGAGPVRRFFWVTLPLLRPSIALALVFRLIQALGIFDLVWVLTGGGPADATRTISLEAYDSVFRHLEPGRGAAVTLLAAAGMFAVALVLGALARGRGDA